LEKEKSQLKEKIQDFYKNGGRYEEKKEIDFGKPKKDQKFYEKFLVR
jgi:hypothetical protein